LFLYGHSGRCPALSWNGSRYICELAFLYKSALAIGQACCAPYNTWREKVRKKEEVYHQRGINLSYFPSSPDITSHYISDMTFVMTDPVCDGLVNNIMSGLE
jgi:hypothetical protein